MAGIGKLLKITAIHDLEWSRDINPVTVPVSFRAVPTFVDHVWGTMEAAGTRGFANLNTPENKNIFKKGIQILCESKVCYAQRGPSYRGDGDTPSKWLYNTEELQKLNSMASTLPYPLAILLECLGNTVSGKQSVTPLLAVNQVNVQASGAVTYSPRQLLPLLRLLRIGVPNQGELHQLAMMLNDLPMIMLEPAGEAADPAGTPPMVRLSTISAQFWMEGDVGQEIIRWTDDEYTIFRQIVQSMNMKKGFNVSVDLSHGQGTLAQTVQVDRWRVDRSVQYFTMTDVSEYDQKLGVAFGFGSFNGIPVQPSRFTGSYTTAYWRGNLIPQRVMYAILD